MAVADASGAAFAGARDPTHPRFALTRYCHVFSSVIREVLETALLHDVAGNGLSLAHFYLLKFIVLTNGHQLHEVAEFLGITPPAATKTVDKLERLGLVARVPCQGDRRATLLTASTAGRLLVQRYETREQEWIERAAQTFTAEDLAALARLLERYSLALVSLAGDRDRICLRCSGYFDAECSLRLLHDGCPYVKWNESARDTNAEVGG